MRKMVRRTSLSRRATAFAFAALLMGVPAVVLRVLCVGGSCDTSAQAAPTTPFCSLPAELRGSIVESTREGRTGDLLAVAADAGISGGTAFADPAIQPLWPSVREQERYVPIVLSGRGIRRGAPLPPQMGLDDVAPTISEALGFTRDHPEVRSGQAVADVVEEGAPRPRLVVLVAWKGVGSEDLEDAADAWPTLRDLMETGASTLSASNNSLSADPAPALTTLGTGGAPSQHGITGSLVRNDSGKVVAPWTRRAPIHVIATLADDLDEKLGQDPLIALVGSDRVDRGLIGGDWYADGDRDLVSISGDDSSPAELSRQVQELVERTDLGKDQVPDLLAVAQEGSVAALDAALSQIAAAAKDAAGDHVLLVVAGTGGDGRPGAGQTLPANSLIRRLEERVPGGDDVVQATGAGEIFLDQDVLAAGNISDDVVLDALLKMKDDDGAPLFADVFPSIAVTFGRFC